MFYYPAVLKRHTGCFSTIWLAATKGIRVPRRDFLKVNVKHTCNDIMSYVLEQIPPPRPGLPRPRFSLYLSSQLQYGVIVVYHRQCAILLEELQSVVRQLVKQKLSHKINMDDHGRQTLLFADALSLLEETEGAPDPLFGVMYMQDAMASPTALIQMGQKYLAEASLEQPDLTSPSAAAAAAAPESRITASIDAITLRETQQAAILAAEFEGEELEDDPATLDLLLAQTDEFPEVTPADQEKERGQGDLEKERSKELMGSTLELQPTTLSSEDALVAPQEDAGLTIDGLGPLADQLTPVTSPLLPALPLTARALKRRSQEFEEVPPGVVKVQRRRRQLIFFDPETQLHQEELQQQISDPQIETRRPALPPPPSRRTRSAAELFNSPCTFLPEEVKFVWRQAATIIAVPGSDLLAGRRGPESTDSEKEREREMVEMAEAEEQRLQLSPKEISVAVPRDLAESEMFEISGHGSLPLEASDQAEASREISPMYPSEREGSTASRSVSTLQDIPEVMDELMGRESAGSPGLMPDLAEEKEEEAPLLFQSLLPPEVDRRTVSNIFQRLLEVLSTRKVCVEQNEPYGDILILPGSNSEEALLRI